MCISFNQCSIRRTQNYVKALALKLRYHPKFKDYLDDYAIEMLYKSAPLHDIGKVGVPDRILLKPGALTAEEFEIMKTHPKLGRDVVASAEKLFDGAQTFLRFARRSPTAIRRNGTGPVTRRVLPASRCRSPRAS